MLSVDLMTFPDSGRFRGIAIVEFGSAEAAEAALAFNGDDYEARALVPPTDGDRVASSGR